MLEKLKSKLIARKLKSIQVGENRSVRACNLTSAKKIGILYEASEQSQFESVRAFMVNLQKKIPFVRALGYVDAKELSDFHIQPLEYSFFCKKDLNWYGFPNEEVISDFCNKEFDILICLNIEEKLPLTCLMVRIKANFKVGIYSETNAKWLDMMLSLDEENKNMNELIIQTLRYLENIHYEQ